MSRRRLQYRDTPPCFPLPANQLTARRFQPLRSTTWYRRPTFVPDPCGLGTGKLSSLVPRRGLDGGPALQSGFGPHFPGALLGLNISELELPFVDQHFAS